ncbi:hypothetical protein [Paenibacillus periandrae]|uniref:hypothetical protein n=1 Tax=Paenibacillus periandrae TaxID=1761741 RepID=UPI001F08DC0B|nr:hypothetical protein [Paenibacillus periandrae]
MFDIKADTILIKGNLEGLIPSDTKILCQTFIACTEFPLRITVYIRDANLVPVDDVSILIKISELLQSEMLFSDNSVNPYTMLKISADHTIKKVPIDIDKYDNCEEVEI